MPVETLRPGLKGAPFCPSDGLKGALCPSDGRLFRLKAPEYLRRYQEYPGAPSRRLSAVERLEADKVKYVKSQQVALTRQAPVIRKALLPPALACPAPGRIQTPPARTAPRHSSAHSSAHSSVRSTGRESVLDLDLLSDLISDVCDGSDGSSVENQPGGGRREAGGGQREAGGGRREAGGGRREAGGGRREAGGGQREAGGGQREAGGESDLRTDCRLNLRSCYKPSSSPRRSLRSTENEPLRPLPRPLPRPLTRPPPVPLRPAHAAAVRRVDVRPSEVRTPQRRPLQLAPPSAPPPLPSPPALPPRSPLLCRAPMPASPAFTRLSNASSRGSRGSARKRPALHRSQSDLSERLSRAAADLQRFFNFCGLDPDEVQALGTERFTPRANSDIVSGRRSVSSASEGEELTERAELAEDREEQVSERTPYGISVIERNARVIKWLYGLRQAAGGGARGGGATGGGATATNV